MVPGAGFAGATFTPVPSFAGEVFSLVAALEDAGLLAGATFTGSFFASVLISSPNSLDIHLLNTVNIETSAYQNAMEQMVRPVILQLKDSEGNPLTADGLQVMDQAGSPLSVVILSDDTCAVLLGDNTAVSALTVRLSGYADCQIPVDAGQRLSMLAVTMNK